MPENLTRLQIPQWRRAANFLPLVVLGLVAGCSSDGETENRNLHRCAISRSQLGIPQTYCVQYQGLTPDQITEVQQLCREKNGLWLPNSQCPASNTKGKCHFATGKINFTFYYYEGFDENTALENCLAAQGQFEKISSGSDQDD